MTFKYFSYYLYRQVRELYFASTGEITLEKYHTFLMIKLLADFVSYSEWLKKQSQI